ncbi:DUF4097 family beta strand repeat protein [Flagellimonas onchidii]|uniref:DUF4097 family beta strand repeat protein n=1 Tax=Flagellimonas onchidii TaxID=2562684 RepID=UPI0010A6ADAF|nr:DUF4097 family beta strand repeat protein [Allomuricauda onchidii]
MSRNLKIWFNVFLFGLTGIVGLAQEKSKTYKETFNVDKETVLNIDTSHADIEFETWDKNQVEITAVVELEGATEEEAKTYFEKDVVKILGNSKEIEIKTLGNSFNVVGGDTFAHGFDFVMPDINIEHHLESLENIEISEIPEVIVIPEMPPMPPIPHMDFDYDAYRKDGDKYMKEWKKNFDKNFDKNYKKRFEEWSASMEKMGEEREKQREQLRQQRLKMREQAQAIRENARAKRDAMREERDRLREERDRQREEHRSNGVFTIHSDDDSNIFYFSSEGERKKYKVKKSIKVKMPKSVKLKMNVRHGEVKLAANTKNIKASLSYASLLASTIDGDRTDIRASYSPVVVQKWNYGQLKANYSDYVDLKEVGELTLSSVSSNVTIDRLLNKVYAVNNLGGLQINSVSNNFSNVDITVENGEVDFAIPSTPFTIYVNETTSDVQFPKVLTIEPYKNYNANVYKGYYINNKADKTVNINSKYSEVVLKE